MVRRMRTVKRWNIPKKHVILLMLGLFLFVLIQLFFYVEKRLAPVIRDYADLRVIQIATDAISDAIKKRTVELKHAGQLFVKQYDQSNNVVAISLDVEATARVQAMAAESVRQKMADLSRQRIQIPLGVALGSEVFANMGPRIPVTLVPLGATEIELEPVLEETGINNVLLTLYLNVKTRVKVVIPFSSKEAVVSQRIAIAQELIIGKVPQYYFKGSEVVPMAPPMPSTPAAPAKP
ncbi:MAG: sporulation protein YunB [Candidatus Carbobacillus altaicus]|uniref:Sporulation protein YunB n=1 Tax=Candidatus Carbonibacillus altaicus TaxID=2163959 RepID=A0A2R6Y4R2_9BACL|nr:sporulation protein YunB [Candidatus Carbobacillus altaicus]PTQ57644.1 MAG: hypothetical protein BSOLF_1188 [Candidatus Carbobacillus altaicus]